MKLKGCFCLALSILPVLGVETHELARGEDNSSRAAKEEAQDDLNSESRDRREGALEAVKRRRRETIRQATAAIEAWERARTNPTIDSSSRPAEYVALRILVEIRAVEKLPLILRNIAVRDASRASAPSTEPRPLDAKYPFLEAATEISAPYIEMINAIQRTNDPVVIQLNVVGLRDVLSEKVAEAAIDDQIERTRREHGNGIDSLRLARNFVSDPRVMFELYSDWEKK